MKSDNPAYKIKVTPLKRAIMIILIVLQTILFFGYALKLVHYIGYPIPFLFSSPTLFTQTPFSQTHLLWNALLYLAFFAQHYIMSAFWFKKLLASIYPEYPFYQRYIFNICSGFLYISILDHVKPTYQLLFQGHLYLQLAFVLIGVFLFVQAHMRLGHLVMHPIDKKKVFNDQQLEMEAYDAKKQLDLVTAGTYGWCRHPMQAAFILLFLFASPYYTKQRLVFIAVHVPAIIFGVVLEESRNSFKFVNYEKYKKEVPHMFLKWLF